MTRRMGSAEKILSDKAFNIAKNKKYDGCQRDLASMVYKFLENQLLENLKNKKLTHLL